MPEEQEETFELNAEVAKAYDLAPGTPPVFEHFTLGKIDIRTVSPDTVKSLVDGGNTYFIPKKAAAVKATGAASQA